MMPRDPDGTHDGALRARAVLVGLIVLSAFLMAGMGLLAWIVGVWLGSILAGAGVVLVLCWAVELCGDEFRDRLWPRGGLGPAPDRIMPCDPTWAARPSDGWFEEFAAAAGWDVSLDPLPDGANDARGEVA